jgi:hypothetical protein
MMSVIPGAIAMGVTIAAVSVLTGLLRNARPVVAADGSGTIEPEKISAWLTVIGGSAFALGGVAAALFADAGWAGLALTVMGLCIGGFMAPSLSSVHKVVWNEDGIEGPSKMFGPTLGLARTAIPWGDIKRTGTTITSYWYVEANDGRRIYWSYLYKGFGVLTAMLRLRRPDVPLPAKMG